MRFSALALSLAALAAVILVAYGDAPGRSMATSPPSAQRFSIDMRPAFLPANTATSLGTREYRVRINENGVMDADEDFVDTIEFDVTATGIPASNAMIGYTYALYFPDTSVSVISQQPMMINPPSITSDPLPDTVSPFNTSTLDPGGSGVSGSGVLDRLRIQSNFGAVAGVYPLTLSNAAHIDTTATAWAPDALDNALICIDVACGPGSIDIEMVSLSLTSANPVPLGVNSTVTVSGTVSNPSGYTLSLTARTTFTVPPGCTVDGGSGTVTVTTSAGPIPGLSTIPFQQTPTLRCTVLGPLVMPGTSCIFSLEADDPVSSNDCMTQNLNFDVVVLPGTDGDGDGVYDLDEFSCGVATFGVSLFPERLNGLDDDGDTAIDEALPPGSGPYDCDGDGYVGTTEAYVFGVERDQARCGLGNWPADIVAGGVPDSTDRVNVGDFITFLLPVRHLNTNVGDNPGNVRWDLVPGKGVFLTDINVADLISLTMPSPPMFNGARAFNGPACTP